MSRIKKSRTAGNSEEKFTGKRKETSAQAQESRNRKRKAKLKGNKPGARNIVESKQTQNKNVKQADNQKRVGSKKAVTLVIEDTPKQTLTPKVAMKPKAKIIKNNTAEKVELKLSPEKELASIENDERLNDFLEQLDNEEILSSADQSWVETQMARHQQLMQDLGWLDDDGEEDLLQQFDDAASALDEFKK